MANDGEGGSTPGGSGIQQARYNWFIHVLGLDGDGTPTDYVAPEDSGEGDEGKYITRIIYGTPLRETKCLFVPEMNSFYTDEELNSVYHSADEYRNAVKKYGLIYKSQKFENADNTTDLLEYAKDYIKNNYHGGIANFTITALDMRMMGYDVRKYTVGLRVNVVYQDPGTNEETRQTLTVISAEYDLNNPDKNQYKVGIPDVTLDKVYGETSKSGGGGGGGKSSDETDGETNTAVDGLTDNQDESDRDMTETKWAFVYKNLKEGNYTDLIAELLTPTEKNPSDKWFYGLTPDALKTKILESTIGKFGSIKIGGVELNASTLQGLIDNLNGDGEGDGGS